MESASMESTAMQTSPLIVVGGPAAAAFDMFNPSFRTGSICSCSP